MYYGITDAAAYSVYPRDFDALDADSCREGLQVSCDIYQAVVEIKSLQQRVQPEIMGIPIGKEVLHTYFLIPLGLEEDIYYQKYILLCVSGEEDAEAIREIIRKSPSERKPDSPSITFRATLRENSNSSNNAAANYISSNYKALMGIDFVRTTGNQLFATRVVPYTLTKDYRDKADPLPIIIGGALVLVGAGLSVLLAAKIKREKGGY